MRKLMSLGVGLSLLWGASVAMAHTTSDEYTLGELVLSNAWSKELPPTAQTGIAFFSVTNNGEAGDRLISAKAESQAETAEIHAHVHENDMMKMVKVDELPILAGEKVVLEPSGYHIMLIDLKKPLIKETSFPLELEFEKAGSITVEVKVLDSSVIGAPDTHQQHSHH